MALTARWLHLLAAITWVGGMLFIALVLVPVARRLDPALRVRLVHDVGLRFRTVGWIAVGVLVVTGLLNLSAFPFLLASPRFLAKLALVALALALAVTHDFVLGPRAGAPGAGPRARRRASWVARVNLVIVLLVTLLGLTLLRA